MMPPASKAIRLVWLLILAACSPQPPQQPQPGDVILEAAAAELRAEEPSWSFGMPICNVPPLPDEAEVWCGMWWNTAAPRNPPDAIRLYEEVNVSLHRASDPAAVTRFLTVWRANPGLGWNVVPYDIGAPAYLVTYATTGRLGILYGRGRFVVTVDGESQADIERIAKALLRHIPPG